MRRDAGFFGEPHQIYDGAHAELLHHPSAVDLDGLFHRSQIAGDLLVEPAGDNVGQDFAFPRRQGGDLGLDGLELQQALSGEGSQRPVIFLTGKGDIPTSVRAMRAGAIDFLTKPVNDDELLVAIARAVRHDADTRHASAERDSITARFAILTPREREVMTHVIAGRLNKQIAGDLGTVEKTIKVHRGRMMEKLGVHTVVDLVRLAEKGGIAAHGK